MSETLYATNTENTNNEKCFAKSGYFSIDNKNAMNLKKVNHPDRALIYVDGMFRSVDSSGKEFFYCTYKILAQTIPVDEVDKAIFSEDEVTDVLVPVFDPAKKMFCGTEKSKAIIKLLGDNDCTFWDWGYSDAYPSKNNSREITSVFNGTAYTDIVRNYTKSCYDVSERSQIYMFVLGVSDRKDKHNMWKNSYSARVDLESVDSGYLRDLNEGELFNPLDLLSDDKSVKNKARSIIKQAIKKVNLVCDESLKCNVLQGIRLADDISLESGSGFCRKPFKATKRSLIKFKNYSIVHRDSSGDEGSDKEDSDDAVEYVEPKLKKKKYKKKKDIVAKEKKDIVSEAEESSFRLINPSLVK